MKEKAFLKKGLFELPWMQSRIKTRNMTAKERWLGYFLGPVGVIISSYTVTELKELFYTSVVPIDNLYGTGTYLSLTTVTSIIGIIVGLIVAWIVERTISSAGKMRPYIFCGSLLMIICSVGIFSTPFELGSTTLLVWLFAVNILYTGIATQLWGLRYSFISLSTRNQSDRTTVTTLRTAGETLIGGMMVGLFVSSILYYQVLAKDMTGDNWRVVILIAAIIAVPLFLLEYFFTRERVTEEERKIHLTKEGKIQRVPLFTQIKALLTNKYNLLVLVMVIATNIATYLQGSNIRTNYCQWILGANAENNIQMIYFMIAMQPAGLGVLILYPLAKKYGARKIVMISSVIYAIGAIPCLFMPYNVIMAFAGGFVANVGLVAFAYLFPIFTQQANDMIEYEHGFRPEGTLSAGLVGAVVTMVISPASGLYETVLMKLGYNAYEVTQNERVKTWIIIGFLGVVLLRVIVIFICLIFFDVEKKLPIVHQVLRERLKHAAIERGEEWVEPEEQEKLEKEANDRQAEADRIADLKERCAKKGLNFDVENQKYLQKIESKKEKELKKHSRKG